LAAKVAQALAAHDGAAAAEWAVRQPPGAARDAAFGKSRRSGVRARLRRRLSGSSGCQRAPSGMPASRNTPQRPVYADPRAAAEWVASIATPKAQQSAAAKMFWVWNSEDPVAARAWLKELGGVDEAWRVRLLKTSQ
jgi:hypothetical protein